MTIPKLGSLSSEDLGPDPISAFQAWFREAQAGSRMEYPDAVCLSTVDPEGWPQGRIVLLKGADPDGFVFFTNARSQKGAALARTPHAALTFYWDDLGRQVRVQGSVERVPEEESDAYFRTRPRGSQVGAWASRQSEPLESRAVLEARADEIEALYAGQEVPRPSHWGGFRLIPREIEFWQARESRLHDRIRYRRGGPAEVWVPERLSP
jgi:pyridoxamine 5'-phosphate oxidase